MLNIEMILKISEQMDIEIKDSISNKHYIMDNGECVEFDTEMLINTNKGGLLENKDLRISDQFSFTIKNSVYKLSSDNATYTSDPVVVNDSITSAA